MKKDKAHLRLDIDPELKEKLKRDAEKERRSMTSMIEYLIMVYKSKNKSV